MSDTFTIEHPQEGVLETAANWDTAKAVALRTATNIGDAVFILGGNLTSGVVVRPLLREEGMEARIAKVLEDYANPFESHSQEECVRRILMITGR